ncbi:hypothetical protein [Phaffia rhodozyma]|uniref:Uncharacterized protein n=1 Tax=Phaffia rhodozyma TaxID=264483 RepID=A0A0F7SNE3_PHARH|nr:hypothetical protein [Phaffia rhodozyma]
MRPTIPLQDSSYGVRSISDSFSFQDPPKLHSIDNLSESTDSLDHAIPGDPFRASPVTRPQSVNHSVEQSKSVHITARQASSPQEAACPVSRDSLSESSFQSCSSSSSSDTLLGPASPPPAPSPSSPPAPISYSSNPLPFISTSSISSFSASSFPSAMSSPPMTPNSFNFLSHSASSELLSHSISSLGSFTTQDTYRSSSQVASDEEGSLPTNMDQEASNGNLVLPTIASLEAGVWDEVLVREETEGLPDVRLVLVVGDQDLGGDILNRVAEEIGVQAGEGSTDKFTKCSSRGVGKDEKSTGSIWLSCSASDPRAVDSLLRQIHDRHLPLAKQLSASTQASDHLGIKDIFDLAATGKGRGALGWIDCCLVLIDPSRLQQCISTSRRLAPRVPTLLLSTAPLSPSQHEELYRQLSDLSFVDASRLSTPSDPALEPSGSVVYKLADKFTPLGSFNAPSSPFVSPLQDLFLTRRGVRYLNHLCARGFLLTRADYMNSLTVRRTSHPMPFACSRQSTYRPRPALSSQSSISSSAPALTLSSFHASDYSYMSTQHWAEGSPFLPGTLYPTSGGSSERETTELEMGEVYDPLCLPRLIQGAWTASTRGSAADVVWTSSNALMWSQVV